MTLSRISESISLPTVADWLFIWQSVGKDTHYTFYEWDFININKWMLLHVFVILVLLSRLVIGLHLCCNVESLCKHTFSKVYFNVFHYWNISRQCNYPNIYSWKVLKKYILEALQCLCLFRKSTYKWLTAKGFCTLNWDFDCHGQ